MLNSPDAELTCYPYITPVWKWPNTQQRPAPHCDCREIRSKYFLVDTHNSITTSWIFCKKYVTVLLSVKFEIILIHGIFIKWGDLLQNVYFSFICCCTISIKKISLIFNTFIKSLHPALECDSVLWIWKRFTPQTLMLCWGWWDDERENCAQIANYVLSPVTISNWRAAHFFSCCILQDPQNVLTIISTKTLIWYNPMFVLYFVYQVLVSKN